MEWNIFKKSTSIEKTEPTKTSQQNLSTPFQEVGLNNLSLPVINDTYQYTNIVYFGTDNLYPQLLNQMYHSSPLHSGIVRFIRNATVGMGYEWVNNKDSKIKVEISMFENKYKFKKLVKILTRDFILHNRVTCIVTILKGKKTFKRVDPSTIRCNKDKTLFVYSSNWGGSIDKKEMKLYENSIKLDGDYLYNYQDESAGQDVYPLPEYNSALNWIFHDGEQSYFHKNNIINSVFPSMIMLRPKEFTNQEEIDNFKLKVGKQKGAKSAGHLQVFTANNKDELPQMVQVTSSGNDKLFFQTSKEIKDNISFAHMINPSIMGVKYAGSLGNSEELKTSYALLEKNVVLPLREDIEYILNDLISITGMVNGVTINNFQLLDDTIKEIIK